MSDVTQLRAALHLAVDLACDILERSARRSIAPRTPVVHDVSETDQAFARRELERQGWAPARKAGSRR